VEVLSSLRHAVPYVAQPREFYCTLASETMIYRYWGVYADIYEILHHRNVPFSFACQPESLSFAIGYAAPGWYDSSQFLADLYGCSYELIMCKCWEDYMATLNSSVTPVITMVDPYYYAPAFKSHTSHAVVVTEVDSKSIHINDPAAHLLELKNGINVPIPLENFVNCVKSVPVSERYLVMHIYKQRDPLPEKERLSRALERNAEILNGKDPSRRAFMLKLSGFKFGISALEIIYDGIDDRIERCKSTEEINTFLTGFCTAIYMIGIEFSDLSLFFSSRSIMLERASSTIGELCEGIIKNVKKDIKNIYGGYTECIKNDVSSVIAELKAFGSAV